MKTPKTDAARLSIGERTAPLYLPEMVTADFARELERENTRLRQALEGLISASDALAESANLSMADDAIKSARSALAVAPSF